MRNISYRRVSTTTNGQSTERQLFNLGIDFDLEFEDYSSGTNMKNRPQLNECIKTLESGDYLYVHSIDRLARNTGELLTLIQKLKDRGVSIRFMKENIYIGDEGDPTTKAMSNMMLSVLGGVHSFQATMIQESVKDGMKLAKAKGKLIGGSSPAWHKTFQENKAKGLHKRPAFIQKSRDDAQPIVKEITNIIKYSRGNVTQTDIASHLNSAGLTTARGGEFNKGSVSRLIKKFNIDYSNKTKYDVLGG